MRIRKKPWARPELSLCDYFIDHGKPLRGKWRETLGDKIYLELGCGKGAFISQAISAEPDAQWIAADQIDDMLAFARRKTEELLKSKENADGKPQNLTLLKLNIEHISDVFAPLEIDRIYINFPPPWKRHSEFKHRLTHPRQLEQYREILVPGGEIRFKTDDDDLFNDTLVYLVDTGFEVLKIIPDLYKTDEPNIVTEHEKMYFEQGKKIKYCTARRILINNTESK
jgi:tRNA (guanine-N7-)-methyltransferase